MGAGKGENKMSILIEGMKMPKDGCKSCEFDIYGSCLIRANLDKPYEVTHSCPLVELPPHGRLGDLDELEQMFADIDNAPYSEFDGQEAFYSADDAAQIIRLAPTIIPADGGDT